MGRSACTAENSLSACVFYRLAVFLGLLLVGCSGTARAAEVVFVHTGPELQEAVRDGASHIIIRQHLDMRGMEADPLGSVPGALLAVSLSTQSIRVRFHCSHPAFAELIACYETIEYRETYASV